MAVCCRRLPRIPQFNSATHRILQKDSQCIVQRRFFHDYWVQKGQNGVNLRVPILKARHHLGAISSRGDRRENEDRFKVGLMNKLSETEEHQPFYFAIIDGYALFPLLSTILKSRHGGQKCADFVVNKLHTYVEDVIPGETKTILDTWRTDIGGYFRRFHPAILDEFLDKPDATEMTLDQRLTLGFLQADLAFLKENPDDESGACVSVAMIISNDQLPFWDSRNAEIHIAHVGDTKILLCHCETGHAHTVTPTHHPASTIESDRLRKFGRAFATDSFGQERFGLLANTRAFGDSRMKRMGVSAEPDLTSIKLGSGAEEYAFIVLCTDGITGVMSDQEIVDVVKGVKEPSDAAKEIISFAESLGTDDNSSCLVVRLSGWGAEMPDLTKDMRDWRLRNEGIGSRTSRSR